ncbi:MAG: PHB depolymerase family esterase [Pseudomonadota bacterium]
MAKDFMAAMQTSLDLTRGGDLMAATRAIQAALGAPAAVPDVEPAPSAVLPQRTAPRDVEDAEIVGETPPRRARAPLGETLRGLRPRKRADGPDLAPGARLERRRQVTAHGARAVRLHVPASVRAEGAAGLIVMLHGCGQDPDDFARGTGMDRLGEAHRLVMVWPGQDRSANAQNCWTWFEPGQTGRAGEAAIIAEIARDLGAEFGVPEGRTFVAGLSAGGAMAAAVAAGYPEVFAAAGVHSGLAPGSARDLTSAFAAMRGDGAAHQAGPTRPVILFHGDADRTVAPAAADWALRGVDGVTSERRDGAVRHAGRTADGHPVEVWRIAGAGHAWSGGDPAGSYAVASGPDASAQMVRFFLALGG